MWRKSWMAVHGDSIQWLANNTMAPIEAAFENCCWFLFFVFCWSFPRRYIKANSALTTKQLRMCPKIFERQLLQSSLVMLDHHCTTSKLMLNSFWQAAINCTLPAKFHAKSTSKRQKWRSPSELPSLCKKIKDRVPDVSYPIKPSAQN